MMEVMSSTPTQPARKVEWLVWLGLTLIVLTLLLLVLVAAVKMRANLGKTLPVLGQVAEFALTNQNGKAVSLADLRGHAWVADIIFTRCAGPCPKMTRQMKEIQDALPAGSTARLVSLTTDPDFDTPTVFKAYAERFGADPNRWSFLTGTKKQIEALAIDSLKLTAIEKKASDRENADDLFIHSTIFVVVDKQGRLRGVYETTGDGVNPQRARAEILATLHRLERER
jgi:protein SCO1/2